MKTITIAPQYTSFYIAGRIDVDIPTSVERREILASEECINVPCLYWNDGDTTIKLGRLDEVDELRSPDFDGVIATASRKIILFDANVDEFISAPVGSAATRIRIWINHPTEPDHVTIGVE